MKNSGIMTIGGAPWAPPPPPEKKAQLAPAHFGPIYISNDEDCRTCGFHVCACAPLAGFEHYGRMQKNRKKQTYYRKDQSVAVFRSDGWGVAHHSSTIPNDRFKTPQEAMAFADKTWPMAQSKITARVQGLMSASEAAFIGGQPSFKREYMGEWHAPALPPGWSPLKVSGGHEGYQHKDGATLVVRRDLGPNMYYSNGCALTAPTLDEAFKRAEYLAMRETEW